MPSFRQAAPALAVLAVFLIAACSDGNGNALREGGSALSATASTIPLGQVEGAAVVLDRAVGLSGDPGRCVRARLATRPRLAAQAAALDGATETLPTDLAHVVGDCQSAAVLVPAFLASFGELTDTERGCLTDVFLALSATDRAAVSAAVTGVGGGRPGRELGERVQACRVG